jgi:cell division protein FtsI/penicillin-binding protein 2
MNRRRFFAVIAVLALGALAVLARGVDITVFEHAEWQRQAVRQQQKVIEVPASRGSIRTSDGYVLATSVDRVAIQVDTKVLEYPEIFVRAAAPLLNASEEDCEKRITSGRRSVWLAKRVRRDIADQVRELAPQAVVLVPDFARIYPQGSLAAPVVGFVGREELNTVGRAGFEHSFDAVLAGEPEEYLAVNDAIQRKVRLERLHRGRAGHDLELTLNAKLQARCETTLAAALKKHDATAGSAVVVDVRTGSILALASLPSFDPANPGASPPGNWRLRPVQDALEPGSTVKPMVAAAALANNVVKPNERFDCRKKGTTVAGHWVRDHADPGMYTLDEVVVFSANTGIIEVAERVPEDSLWSAFAAFGFGRRTDVGFPAEARGLMPGTRSWSKMSRAGFALGQELTTSPLQLAMAYAAIANGGWLLKPQLLVSRSADGAGDGRRRVMDEALAVRLRRILEDVVLKGTGEQAAIPGYRTAGKTGTAQRAVDGSFDDEHHVAWFAGFFPMPEPRVAVVVAVENPAISDIWASSVSAPVFADIAQASACLLDFSPTEPVASPEGRLAARDSETVEGDA